MGEGARIGDVYSFEYGSPNPVNSSGAFTPKTADSARPLGEWNDVEVRCEGRVLQFLLNGRQVNRVEANRAILCHPGFQSWDTDICIRNIRLVPLVKPALSPARENLGRTDVAEKTTPRKSANSKVADALQPGTVWTGEHIRTQQDNREPFPVTFRLLERKGETFKARFEGPNNIREVRGNIKDGRIGWLAKNVTVIKGDKGFDSSGTIQGEEISLKYSGIAVTNGEPVSGTVTLRLEKQTPF
jgi:Domain of Unknown Function (DUF1080)